jgi:hypothetical protein
MPNLCALPVPRIRSVFLSILLFTTTGLVGAAEPEEPVVFRRDVMAVLSKAGCNMGACHGNQKGKGGFFLSLRGQDPTHDYYSLVADQQGRRINRNEPRQSLLLLKPTAQVPHQGGQRFKADSPEYRILVNWIRQAAGDQNPAAGQVERLEVAPPDSVLFDPQSELQLAVTAHFADGTRRDVTPWAVYEASNFNAHITADGRVTRQEFGETTVVARYLDQQVPARVAFMPAATDTPWSAPPPQNQIDRLILAKLRRLHINPSPLIDDGVFVRRAYLDLLGILPTADQARSFVDDPAPEKRRTLIDTLLARPEFAEVWALKWSDVLRNEEKVLDTRGVQVFYDWMRDAFAKGKPLSQFAADIVSATGSTYQNPPTNFYRALRDPTARSEAVARVFLGRRLQCARCHNHPYDVWTQDDYYDWATLFARVDYELKENTRRDDLDKNEFIGEQIVYLLDQGEVTNPRTGHDAQPRLLGADHPLAGGAPRLDEMAHWLTGPESLFARAQVNRIWQHFMGRGLVDPVDDFRATNPPSHPELLDYLAQDFIDHGWDVRHTIRLITQSATYQLSSRPNLTNQEDDQNYSHVLPRRLTAEQLLDAQAQVLQVAFHFNGYQAGTRAGQLPGVQRVRPRDQPPSDSDRFLVLFGKPQRLLACQCERSDETTLGQALSLVAGSALNDALRQEDNRLGKWIAQGRSVRWIVRELYWEAVAREPSPLELAAAQELAESSSTREALEDVAWALLNSKEFLFRQ